MLTHSRKRTINIHRLFSTQRRWSICCSQFQMSSGLLRYSRFGLKIDLDAVEQEIERQTAISGGKSRVAAMARFALAFTKRSPKDVAAYIDHHRAQLQEHLEKKSISIFEIEMLAQAGLPQQAE